MTTLKKRMDELEACTVDQATRIIVLSGTPGEPTAAFTIDQQSRISRKPHESKENFINRVEAQYFGATDQPVVVLPRKQTLDDFYREIEATQEAHS